MFGRYLLISLFFMSSVHAAEENKTGQDPQVNTQEIATPEQEKPDREKQISTLIEKNLQLGKAVWLGDGDNAFLALYRQNIWKQTQGAILLLHDLDANADWPQLITTLRNTFPEKGWSTLSLQLPLVTTEEEKDNYLTRFDEAVARVNAGITYLKQKNISNIVVIGHGIGSAVGVDYINQNPQAPVSAVIAISLPGAARLQPALNRPAVAAIPDPVDDPATNKNDQENLIPTTTTSSLTDNTVTSLPDRDLYAEMEKITIPFLDIFGQLDYQDVVREAEKRTQAMQKSNNKTYSQLKMTGADHYFRGLEPQLIRRLRGWLKKYAQGMEISVTPSS